MKLRHLLLYNSRHRLYLADGRLHLNPIMSSSHNKDGSRTWDWHEPIWAWRLRQRLFAHAGRQRCGRRDDAFSFNRQDGPAPDTWDRGPDGNRTCSYCGSIHPDDLMAICRKVVDAEPGYAVDGTDKGYKVYVRQPGVRNASEGAIKFYMQHVINDPTPQDQQLFAAALAISSARAQEEFKRRYAS